MKKIINTCALIAVTVSIGLLFFKAYTIGTSQLTSISHAKKIDRTLMTGQLKSGDVVKIYSSSTFSKVPKKVYTPKSTFKHKYHVGYIFTTLMNYIHLNAKVFMYR